MTHVERLMRGRAYDEALAILDEQLAQTPESIGILVQKPPRSGCPASTQRHSRSMKTFACDIPTTQPHGTSVASRSANWAG